MGFLRPKIPTPPPAPNPATPAAAAMDPLGAGAPVTGSGVYSSAHSLISTSAQGLKRRATTQRTSLIGE